MTRPIVPDANATLDPLASGSRPVPWVLLVMASIALAAASSGVRAQGSEIEEFKVIPLKVNVLKNVTMSDDEIQKMVEEANKILKQAKVKLEFDKAKNINRDVDDGGNHNNQISEDELKKLWKAALDELKEKFGEEKGYKIYIADGVFKDGNPYGGLTPHPSGEGNPETVTPVSAIKKTAGESAPKRGRKLAHEIAHALTLGKNHCIDDNTKADDGGHSSNTKNLMYHSNTNGPFGAPSGTELTACQIMEICKGAKKWGKTKQREGDPVITIPDHRHGSWTDPLDDVTRPHIDLYFGTLFAENAGADLQCGFVLGGMHPAGVDVHTQLEVLFDADNNPATGIPIGSFSGIDQILRIHLTGQFPFLAPTGELRAELIDATGVSRPLAPGLAGRTYEIADVEEEIETPMTFDVVDYVRQSVPLPMLGPLAVHVPAGVRATDLASGETDEVSFAFPFGAPYSPLLEMSPLAGGGNEPLQLHGTGFTPLSNISLLVDDTEVGNAVSASDGSFSQTIFFPAAEAGDYFVTARDEFRNFDFSVYKVLQTTPALATAVSVTAEPGVARITWYVADGGPVVEVEKRAPAGDWARVAEIGLDESYARFEDQQVEAGGRYGYRLRLRGLAGEPAVGEIWVDIPSGVALAIDNLRSEAATRLLTLAFSLPEPGNARVEVFTISGRRLIRQDLEGYGPGRHEALLPRSEGLSRGLYVVRLTQGNHSVTAKWSVVR